MRHANISIFVPHLGCPHRCAFCDQYAITARYGVPGPDDVEKAVERAKTSLHYDSLKTEIAFFGGSFTCVPAEIRRPLLNAAFRFVQAGQVKGIRISTRPDALPPSMLEELKAFGVTAVELGAQSMRDEVLRQTDRGHTAEDVRNAALSLREAGFSLGLQMMTGLPADSDAGAKETARAFLELRPDTVRIYPTIVLKSTALAALYESGAYRPQTLEEAVALCAELSELFEQNGVRVIRTGLHTIDPSAYVAGPWHPAFGEKCAARRMLLRVKRLLNSSRQLYAPGEYQIFVAPGMVSKMIGHRRENLERLAREGYRCAVKTDEALSRFEITLQRM